MRCNVSLSAAIKASPLPDEVADGRSGSALLGALGDCLVVLPGKSEDEIDILESSAMVSLGWLFRDAESAAWSRLAVLLMIEWRVHGFIRPDVISTRQAEICSVGKAG
jgi:hypothetical protein